MSYFLESQLSQALRTVPKAMAAGLLNLETRKLIDLKTTSSHPTEVFGHIAAASHDLYEGPNVRYVEEVFRRSRGEQDADQRYFQEILMFSTNLVHYLCRLPKRQHLVFGVATSVHVNVGLVLVKAREAVRSIRT